MQSVSYIFVIVVEIRDKFLPIFLYTKLRDRVSCIVFTNFARKIYSRVHNVCKYCYVSNSLWCCDDKSHWEKPCDEDPLWKRLDGIPGMSPRICVKDFFLSLVLS